MKPVKKLDRLPTLNAARELKMARSAHAYVRGNTVKFYEWLAESPVARMLPVGPPIWICGDCHLGNLGPVSDGDGAVKIQIRDLDQTVVGNPAHDLIRLGLSLATAARGSDLPGVTTAHMVEQMIEGYIHALVEPEDDDAAPEPDVVRSVKRRAMGRRWRHLARERIDGTSPSIPLGKKFWPIEARERTALTDLFADPEMQRQILSLNPKDEDRAVELVDAAYWMKGCSSLGLLRYAALLRINGAKGRADYALVDLKEAIRPAAPASKRARMPKDPAMRVVAGARALSPYLGNRMIAARLLGKSVFIRELAPQDLKLEVEQFSQDQAVKAARYLAYIVGTAHARQMEKERRAAWRKTLLDYSSLNIDAPSWLWDSIVDLSSTHEAGYLQHCRQFALSKAA
ncbi:MAG: DUF2252 family protein [Candidatus Sphingomonas colombiensis]|nr:DUF2252 family protein [Sphingomonas sp.]WEK42250.1 MAG: DUF2252 family protein [Sphingomonas sp.]